MSDSNSSLARVLRELAEGAPISQRGLQQFSDLDASAIQTVMEAWPQVPTARKVVLLDGLRDLSDENTLVSFDDLARRLLGDPDGQVRARAIRLLDECDDPKLAATFLKMLSLDEDGETRRAAAAALGHFVELGELERIPAEDLRSIEDALLEKVSGDDQAFVRRSALESLGYSSRPEVVTLLESAIGRQDPDWQASALVAMGVSSDERWEEAVLARLSDENALIRLAAVRAAGELRLSGARALLFQVLEEEDDSQISGAAIWSLSQLGGEEARLYIQGLLAAADDDDDMEFLEEALENLEFTDELNSFDLLAIDPDEQDEIGTL